jgi:ATP-binding cassette subfamily B (MDR/TAP) protein 1
VILSVSPLIVFGGSFQFRGVFGFNQQSKMEFESANRLASEAIGNVRTVVSFTGENSLLQRFDQLMNNMVYVGTRSALVQGIAYGVANAIVFAVYCLSFWYGSTLISSGEMDFQQFLKVYFAISMTATSIGRSSSYSPDYTKARRATYNIFALLDRVPPIDSWDESGAPAQVQGVMLFATCLLACRLCRLSRAV